MNKTSVGTLLSHPHRSTLCSLLVLFTLLVVCPLYAQDAAQTSDKKAPTVIFPPFTVELKGNYQYLEQGLSSVLASRLATRTGINTLHQGGVPRDIAATLAGNQLDKVGSIVRQANADYLILGSISGKASDYQLTAYVFASTAQQPPRKFSQDVSSIDDAMDGIDTLAWDIAEGIFGVPRPKESAPSVTGGTGMAAFQTAHPDRAYREGLFQGTEGGLLGSGAFTLVDTRSSRRLDFSPVDMATADIDGDGNDESVLVSHSQLMIYQFVDDGFQHKATVDLDTHLRVHALTVADVNGNGRPELYISGNNGNLPASNVLEWVNGKMVVLLHAVPYYLRAESTTGEHAQLFGQSSGLEGPAGGPIFQLSYGGEGQLVQGAKLSLPAGLNLFDFVQADLTGDGAKETVAIDRANMLKVYDAAGSQLWQSSSIYGATDNYLGTKTTVGLEQFKNWVPARILVQDIDGDGHADVVVGRNRLETVRFMKQIRYWEGSSIAALTWRDNGLAPLWETRKIGGYTMGYGVRQHSAQEMTLTYAEGPARSVFSIWDQGFAVLHRVRLQRQNTGEKQ